MAKGTGKPGADKVEILATWYETKEGDIMPGMITLGSDLIAHTPVAWTRTGSPVAAPSDAEAVSSDTSIATVELRGDMTDLNTIPVKTGTCSVTVQSNSLSIFDMVSVTVVSEGSADAVVANAGLTTFTPKLPA